MADKKDNSELISGQEGEAFALWDLPSFDAPVEEADGAVESDTLEVLAEELESVAGDDVQVEDVEAEDVKPLTLDEVEAVRQDAWNEGFSTGEKDGFHAGQLKATQEAEVALRSKVQALEHIMRQFFEPIATQDQQLEEAMLQMVMQISRQVIQRELVLDSSQIKDVVREALKLLPMNTDAVRVHVNPQDFEQIKALRARHEESWKIVEDDELLPGGCRFESVNTQINASIETRIEHIAAQLLDQQHELKNKPLAADLEIPLDAPLDKTEPVEPVEPAEDGLPSSEGAAPALEPITPEASVAPRAQAQDETTTQAQSDNSTATVN